ncbi:MAG TPA: hypothetical protein VM243_06325 [Phycisphaerae bacterium]|nr:hypothetical protein [Phycisphaerae bacterium]
MRQRLTAEVRQAHNIEGDLPSRLDSTIGVALDSERTRQKAFRLAREADEKGETARAFELERTGHLMAKERDQAIRRLGLTTAAGDGDGDGFDAMDLYHPTTPSDKPAASTDPEPSTQQQDAAQAT